MVRGWSVKDTKNPPGQIGPEGYGPDTLQRNIEQWKKYEKSLKGVEYLPCICPGKHSACIKTCDYYRKG